MFGTLMKANGEDIKTIQELSRHSNYKVTADTWDVRIVLLSTPAGQCIIQWGDAGKSLQYHGVSPRRIPAFCGQVQGAPKLLK